MKLIHSTQIENKAFFSPSDEILIKVSDNMGLLIGCMADSLILASYCQETADYFQPEDFDLFTNLGNIFKP